MDINIHLVKDSLKLVFDEFYKSMQGGSWSMFKGKGLGHYSFIDFTMVSYTLSHNEKYVYSKKSIQIKPDMHIAQIHKW